jgi:hypothetical protein
MLHFTSLKSELTNPVFSPNHVVNEDQAKITDSNGTLKPFTAIAQSGNEVEVIRSIRSSLDIKTQLTGIYSVLFVVVAEVQ